MSPALQQRCWNHPEREASCRCPRCGRSFCRECVTEHESQLLCVACLQIAARASRAKSGVARKLLPAGMLLFGLALAWLVFDGVGQAFLESMVRPESSWQNR